MEKKPYLKRRQLVVSDFATTEIFVVVTELDSPIMSAFEDHINEVQCSFRKYVFKLIEDVVQVKHFKDLVLDFNKDREDESSAQELCLEPTSKQNADMDIICEGLRRFFKGKANSFEAKSLEQLIFRKLEELIEQFRLSIVNNDPESFHRFKRVWLNQFNEQKMKVRTPAHA